MHALPPATTADARTPPQPARQRRVVDAPTRMFHWLFALCFLGAYLTGDSERWRMLHVTLGYAFAGLLAFRLVYGRFGPPQARLSALRGKLAAGTRWLREAMHGRTLQDLQWHKGQNLLMALAIACLLALPLPLTLTGYAVHAEWVDGEWLEELHEFFGQALLLAVLAHLSLIAVLSAWRRRNLAQPMLTGRQPGHGPDLVKRNRGWLAVLLLAAVLGFGAWQWTQSPGGLLAPARAGVEHGHDDD